jgi:hypothetical protein
MSFEFVAHTVVTALKFCDTAEKFNDLPFSSIRVASETPTALTQPQSQQESLNARPCSPFENDFGS